MFLPRMCKRRCEQEWLIEGHAVMVHTICLCMLRISKLPNIYLCKPKVTEVKLRIKRRSIS